jgi:hemolysin activation/secretion protein
LNLLRAMLEHVVRCGKRLALGDFKSHGLIAAPLVGIITALLAVITAPALAAAPNLVSVVIRGSSVYDAPTLYSVYREQLGKPITQDGARAIVGALAAKYESDGYSRPQLRVDDGLLQAGVLRVDVFEPRISEVRISGDPGPHLARLESLGSRLQMDGPVRQARMQTALRQMRALPGLTVAASTAQDAVGPNVYRLEVDTAFEPVSGVVRLSNRGTDEAGPNFVLGQLVANGLLGGQTNIGAMFGAATDYEEFHGLGVLANVGLGSAGARMAFSAFRSRSDPHEPVVDRDDFYLRDRVAAGFVRPLASFETGVLSLSAGLDLDDLAISRAGALLRDERLRMLRVGSSWNWRSGATVQYAGSVDLVKGLDALGSGLDAFDLADDPRRADFALSRLTFTRLARFGERWSVRLDVLAQQSSYVLPYGERFKIGGERLGRGFEVAEIAGDQGIGAKIEGRSRLLRAPAALGSVSIYGFYDAGAVWKQDTRGRESAATGGFGFATQGARVSGTLELAQPLTHPDVEGRKELTLFAELAISL